MARIQCPGCKKAENLDLQGRYLVKCDGCGKKFVASIIRHKPPEGIDITCPQCGLTENLPLNGPNELEVTCQGCGHSFIISV